MLTSSTKILHFDKRAFSNLINLAVINEFDKDTVAQILAVFGTYNMLVVEETSEMGFFRHLSDYVFRVHNIGNTKSIYLFIYLFILSLMLTITEKTLFTIRIAVKC